MNRRGVLSFLTRAPIAGALAGRAAAEQAAARLSGAALGVNAPATCGPEFGSSNSGPSREQVQSVLSLPWAKKQIESELFAENRGARIAIDPDLAVLRSLSLSAKIAFQRQRNVARQLASMEAEVPAWRRIDSLILKALTPFG